MLNNPVGALHSIVQQFQGMERNELTTLEKNVLRTAADALGWDVVYNQYGEIEKFKDKED